MTGAPARRGLYDPLVTPPADAVLWQEQVVLPSLPEAASPLGDDARVDVLVVGGGYAGLAAAIEVARAGRRVLVLEKDAIGRGAHSRNGGMAIPELKAGPATLAARYGELGRLLVKYGRSDLADHVQFDGLAPADDDGAPPPEAEELADDLEALGPTFIKLGQLLSTRSDVLPSAYTKALSRLQDDAATRAIPVLFVAGGGEADEEQALALGARDCLNLPLRPLVLLARVQAQLRLAALSVR